VGSIHAVWERLPLPPEHAVPLSAGLVMRLWTGPARFPPALRRTGELVVAAGLALNAFAVLARGPGDVDRPSVLTRVGPYAFTRNPMFIGWSLVHLGTGLAARSPMVLAAWPFSAALVHRAVLAEERDLAATFGPDYSAYAARVPRYGSLRRTAGSGR